MMTIQCAHCKKIMGEKPGRDVVTHTVCPVCMAKLYPEYAPTYHCTNCGDDIPASELHTDTEGNLDHCAEGELIDGMWSPCWCGPVEQVAPDMSKYADPPSRYARQQDMDAAVRRQG